MPENSTDCVNNCPECGHPLESGEFSRGCYVVREWGCSNCNYRSLTLEFSKVWEGPTIERPDWECENKTGLGQVYYDDVREMLEAVYQADKAGDREALADMAFELARRVHKLDKELSWGGCKHQLPEEWKNCGDCVE